MGRGMREERKRKEGKATQPSCDERNPRGTEGARANARREAGGEASLKILFELIFCACF